MNKKIKSVFTMFMGTGINAVLGTVSISIMARMVDPGEYGLFSLLTTYINILVVFCLLGLDQAYVRFYYSKEGMEYRHHLSYHVLKVPLLISLFILIMVLALGKYVMDIGQITSFLVGACVVATVVDTFTRLSVRLEQDAFVYSTLLITHRLVYLGLAVLLLNLFNFSSVNVLLIATLLSLVAIIIVAVVNKHKLWLRKYETNNAISYRELFKYCSPFIFSSIVNWVFTATAKFSLNYFSTMEQIGYFAAATNIATSIAIIQTTFSTVWVPMAMENFEKKPDNKRFYISSNDIITLVMTVVGATIILCKDVFGWMLGGNYSSAVYIFPCLILHPIMFTISETTVYGINFYKKTHWHIIITLTCSIVNIIGCILLVPSLGSKGSAISVGLSYVVFLIMRTICSNKYFKVKFHFAKLTIAVTGLVIFALYNTFVSTDIISVCLYIALIAVVFVVYKDTVVDAKNILKEIIKKKKIL